MVGLKMKSRKSHFGNNREAEGKGNGEKEKK